MNVYYAFSYYYEINFSSAFNVIQDYNNDTKQHPENENKNENKRAWVKKTWNRWKA